MSTRTKSPAAATVELSVVLPCRNEELAIGQSLRQITEVLTANNIRGEVIVSDSSSDGSTRIAEQCGAVVIKHNQPGYGLAYLKGFAIAKGRYLFMADPDGSYDFSEIPNFLNYLRHNYDFVIGNRFTDNMARRAMPPLNKYVGNPLLSLMFRLLIGGNITDIHCGMRAISRQALDKMQLQTTGMEFASEMIAQAVSLNLTIKQLPIDYQRRLGQSKLKPFSDGWRHLKFMLNHRSLSFELERFFDSNKKT